MKYHYDPDIGICDDCGSVDGRRVKRSRVVRMFDGEQAQIIVWLCKVCRNV